MTRVVMLAGLVAVAGCFPAGDYECDRDLDCSGGEVCARTHECLTTAEVRSVRIRWTIEGDADTATACGVAGIGDLEVRFGDNNGSSVGFSPVPCGGGLYSIDKLPVRFNQVELSGSSSSASYFGVTIMGSDPEYTIDLQGN